MTRFLAAICSVGFLSLAGFAADAAVAPPPRAKVVGVLQNIPAQKRSGQNNQKDDGQKNQKDDGQQNQYDNGQRNQNDDGQKNQKNNGQKNQKNNGQK